VDFVVDAGGRLELFEAKWTELPDLGDTVNLEFVRNVIGKSRVAKQSCSLYKAAQSAQFSRQLPDAGLVSLIRQQISGQGIEKGSFGKQSPNRFRKEGSQFWRGGFNLIQKRRPPVHDGNEVFEIVASEVVRLPTSSKGLDFCS
jgi:hypothetical protein